jgi:hypothetical protein
MAAPKNPHDDAPIRAAKKRREQRRREEQRDEWHRFDRLTSDLLRVPKTELDEKRKEASS